MAPRLYLRTGEVPALFGLDSARSEWSLWNTLRQGEDQGVGDYGRWQSRLMVPIMQGVAEDHGLKIEKHLDPRSTVCGAIMPPRCWKLAPSLATNGRPALLVVAQRTEGSLRDWKEPGLMPDKALMRFRAVAAAHDIADVIVGVLVDGYSSRIYHVTADEDQRAAICERVQRFIADVESGEEPDIDFEADARAIRSGHAVAKVEAAAGTVNALLDERAQLIASRAPVDTQLKHIEARMRQIDTNLIHLAGETGKLDVDNRLVVIERDAKKGMPRVTVVEKAPAALF